MGPSFPLHYQALDRWAASGGLLLDARATLGLVLPPPGSRVASSIWGRPPHRVPLTYCLPAGRVPDLGAWASFRVMEAAVQSSERRLSRSETSLRNRPIPGRQLVPSAAARGASAAVAGAGALRLVPHGCVEAGRVA